MHFDDDIFGDLDIEEDSQDTRGKHPRIPDSHLQSPIRICTRSSIFKSSSENPPHLARTIDGITKYLRIHIDNIEIHSERFYGVIFKQSRSSQITEIDNWVVKNYGESYSIILEIIKETHIRLNLPVPDTKENISNDTMKRLSYLWKWTRVRRIMQNLRGDEQGVLPWKRCRDPPPPIADVYLSGHLLLWQNTLRGPLEVKDWIAFDYEQVLMICDTIAARVFTIWLHECLPSNIPGSINPETLIQLYDILDDGILDKGNKIYDEISAYEGICFGLLIRDHDSIEASSKYDAWLIQELEDKQHSHALRVHKFISDMKASPSVYAELHGLFRHWGHPTVDELAGCHKVQSIGKTRTYPDILHLSGALGALKRQFYISFLHRHGRSPRIKNLSWLKERRPKLHKLLTQGRKVLNIYNPDVSLSDWSTIRFNKEFDFDYHADYTDLMDDKSLAPLRSELRSIYCPQRLHYQPKSPTSSRRVLQEVLNRPTIDIKQICERVNRGNIPEDWKIIILHAKERELKISARLFAMMTLEMRLYFCATEANLAKTLFKYFPQQTMTSDEPDLMKRLFYLSDNQRDPDKFLSIINSIDFSSWNLCHTYQLTEEFFLFIDDLFGTQHLYTRSHWFFGECLVSLSSNLNPPRSLIDHPTGTPYDCETLWTNHGGGFEGLRQKGWTLITIALLLYVESMTGIKGYIIGQGDNQVCKILLPVPDDCLDYTQYLLTRQDHITAQAEWYIGVLKQIALTIGLIVKPEETSISRDILIYGKDIIYKGSFLPQMSKRISRILDDVNEVYPTLATQVSTIQTAGMACSQKGLDYVAPYLLSTCEALVLTMDKIRILALKRKIDKKQLGVMESGNFKEFLLCLSSEVGGFPILSPLSFFYRGHPDSVTTHLTFLDLIKNKCRAANRILNALESGVILSGRESAELLVANPCSLNLEAPPTIANLLKNRLEDALKEKTRNLDLIPIFRGNAKELDKDLYMFLVNLTPCHPRIIHEIFRNTVTGAKLMYIAKHMNTRTTRMLLSRTGRDADIPEQIGDLELELIKHWYDLYHRTLTCEEERTHSTCTRCPTELAKYIRNRSWRRVIKGDIQGVTIPHPAHQFCFHPFNSELEPSHASLNELHTHGSEHVMYTAVSPLCTDLLLHHGPYQHYVGSLTQEKKAGLIYQIPYAGRPLEAAKRLIQLDEWLFNPFNISHTAMVKLAASRTNIDISTLAFMTRKITGGSAVHRLQDHVTKKGTLPNMRPNLTSSIYFSTDKMGRFSRGLDNFNLHYQGVITLGFFYLQMEAIYGEGTQHGKMHYAGTCCEEKLEDFLIDSDLQLESIYEVDDNPLLYARVEEAQLIRPPGSTGIVRYVRNVEPALAAATILLDRILKASALLTIGHFERPPPIQSILGVAEVSAIGVSEILKYLSCLIYLVACLSSISALSFTNAITTDQLSDLALVCLLPEVREEFYSIAGLPEMSELYTSPRAMARSLKNYLLGEVFEVQFNKGNQAQMTRIVFFPSEILNSSRVLHMWAQWLSWMTDNKISIQSLVEHIEGGLPYEGIFSTEFDSLIMDLITKSSGIKFEDFALSYHIKISEFPMEKVLRQSRGSRSNFAKLHRDQIKSMSDPRMKRREYTPWTTPLLHQPRGYIAEVDVNDDMTSPIIRVKPAAGAPIGRRSKTRSDHQYRLYGKTSTSYCKFAEILERERIQLSGPACCLAEGEGSIARLLLLYGSSIVYYNTLINKSKLVPHRAYDMIPSCLTDMSHLVKWIDINVLTGGDLSSLHVIKSLMKSSPEGGFEIVTCDAEGIHDFNVTEASKIIAGAICVAIHGKSQLFIIKVFSSGAFFLAQVVSAIRLVYHNVRVVVPCFSSHESTEVYVIAKAMVESARKDLSCYLRLVQDGGFMIRGNWKCHIPRCVTLSAERMRDQPLQRGMMDYVLWCWDNSPKWGFQNNLSSCLSKICLSHATWNQALDIKIWLSSTYDSVRLDALRCLLTYQRSSSGDNLEEIIINVSNPHHSLRIQMEHYCLALMNLTIVEQILGIPEGSVQLKMMDTVSKGFDLDYKYSTLFSYYPDISQWSKDYLKTMWRIWGHHNYKRMS
ncbi:MAG: RNA-dependent RNA polymerase [Hangzhou acrida cinerea lispivirus 1]|uniref:RNA-directed RNA polymerase L n=1 Tax=Hangzhou acrida cinerea lispivirus 1 TaxID=2905565 RepID=A0A8K1XVZ7_9MONO|nr:MAG: RNA-dependent RNA polymerase [Hangzhou acrida cinerea lispivirus 1]UHK03318.1 MAG: RNA-dependent RNA polymerase [Hangzhou acrida cinerea lispivirus 1]